MSRPGRWGWLVAAGLLLGLPGVVQAGMPNVTLSDVARMRVQSISFFLLGFLLSAWLLRGLWNYLRRDFASLPQLTYGKSLGLVSLWGLLFVLVLTMISGARELMSPGAWEKRGATYRLADQGTPAADDSEDRFRRWKLEQLRDALWDYARVHGQRFPADGRASAIAHERWQSPDPSGLRYVYVSGGAPGRGAVPVAYEPEVYGAERWVLLTSGEIRRMAYEQIVQSLPGEKP